MSTKTSEQEMIDSILKFREQMQALPEPSQVLIGVVFVGLALGFTTVIVYFIKEIGGGN